MYRILSFVDVHFGFMVANIRLPSYMSLGKLNLYLFFGSECKPLASKDPSS